MIPSSITLSTAASDADLVLASRAGDRTAFRQIVERYQTLICSVAYSATGDITQSEDLAQETFVTAWSRLEALREPDKLRSWLCGIVRNRVLKFQDRNRREPAHDAASLDEVAETPSRDAAPTEEAISREEQAILWRSLERIPELYREPLILFYREHQSVAEVATQLELSEDAVKQRLSRGRKLLQDEVQSFVESALRRTAPGSMFCGSVLASLPLAAAPLAVAGGLGAKGSAASKAGSLVAWLAPLAGVVAGLAAQLRLVQDTMPDGSTKRRVLLRVAATWVAVAVMAIAGDLALDLLGRGLGWERQGFFVGTCVFWWAFAGTAISLMYTVFNRQYAPASELPASLEAPIRTATLAWTIGGFHFSVFSWFIFIAWRIGDRAGAAAMTAAMVALATACFFSLRGRPVVRATAALSRWIWMACGTALAGLNLRLDVWLSSGYGVPVSEVHRLVPYWIVPALSLLLVAWVAAVVRAKRPAESVA